MVSTDHAIWQSCMSLICYRRKQLAGETSPDTETHKYGKLFPLLRNPTLMEISLRVRYIMWNCRISLPGCLSKENSSVSVGECFKSGKTLQVPGTGLGTVGTPSQSSGFMGVWEPPIYPRSWKENTRPIMCTKVILGQDVAGPEVSAPWLMDYAAFWAKFSFYLNTCTLRK